jgi:hypothetical protein
MTLWGNYTTGGYRCANNAMKFAMYLPIKGRVQFWIFEQSEGEIVIEYDSVVVYLSCE